MNKPRFLFNRSIPVLVLISLFLAPFLVSSGQATSLSQIDNSSLETVYQIEDTSIGECSPATAEIAYAISANGYGHSCVVTSTGGVECWGWNYYGQLGDGTTTNRSSPVDVKGLSSGVAAVIAGSEGGHSCALMNTGGVKCWGWDAYGQLGNGDTTNSPVPVDVIGLSDPVQEITGGNAHTCALTSSGGVKCWGWNIYGQLGDGTLTNSSTPVDVIGLSSGVKAVIAGGFHTCALTEAGGVKCWGQNNHAQLGDGTTSNKNTPVDVVGLTSGITAVAAGDYHTCARTMGGGLKCWGSNDHGQLGNNTSAERSPTPVDVFGLSSGVTAFAAGGYHTCALTDSGETKCWGWNGYGQVGDNSNTNRATPVDVVGLDIGVTAISAGHTHTCAITSAGGVKCWGDNYYNQLGDGTNINRNTPVDVIGFGGIYTISGRVIDGNNNPVPGVTVSTNTNLYAITSGSGDYSITNISIGTCTITPSKNSYIFTPPSQTVVVPPNQSEINFTLINNPPTVDAGGPYTVDEGNSVTLTATGTDPENGPLTYAWDLDNNGTFETPGQSVSFTGVDGPANLAVNVQVTDNGGLTAVASATVTVNNVAPIINSVTNNGPINEGSSATITVNATDLAGANDPLTYEFDCNNESAFETTTGSCAFADNGTYTVNVRVSDDDDGVATGSTVVTVNNVVPTATFNTPASVNEGSDIVLSLTNPVDVPADLGSLQYAFDCGSGYVAFSASNTASCPTVDNGTRNVGGKVMDKDGGVSEYTATVTINNVAPTVKTSVVSPEPSTEGSGVTASGTFSDPAKSLDMPYICTVNYGDGSGEWLGEVSDYTCTGPLHVYPTYGAYMVTISVTDKDGGTGSKSATHIVIFNWFGFFPPVDNLPTLNVAKAGSAIPVKFSLGGNKGLTIFASGYPQSMKITCDTGALLNDIEQTVNAGSSSLTYDPLTDQYAFIWKTNKAWAGTCRQLVIKLIDGTEHVANFKFK